MPAYDELPLNAQTAYAELAEATRVQAMRRSVGDLHGSFAHKTIKGRRYWYFQFRDVSGKVRQLYVGPDSAEVQSLIARADDPGPRALARLARSAIALGAEPLVPRHFRIVRRLAEHGFFRVGGVLVRTHAFLAMGNALGVRWKEGSRTQDVDFAHAGKNVAIALPSSITIDAHKAIESLQMGFLPTTSFEGRPEATWVSTTDPSLRIDFLTTKTRGADPVVLPNLNVALQPLPFMEFLLEHPIQAPVFSEDGSVLVNIPDPARFAVHKLIVARERGPAHRTKVAKDLLQAAALIAYYGAHRPEELQETWRDALSRGKGWERRARAGLRETARLVPDLEIPISMQ